MWKKILVIVFLFYFFALLQSSFLTHFNLFGYVPNLIFILFFLLVFFSESKDSSGRMAFGWKEVFSSLLAGLTLDILYCAYLGPSIVLLLLIAFLAKTAKSLLRNRKDDYPFAYFLPLFIISFLFYILLLGLYFYFWDPNRIFMFFNAGIIFSIIYNSIVASLFFYLYKNFLFSFING